MSNNKTGQLSTQGNTYHIFSTSVNEEQKGHMSTQQWVTGAGKQRRLHQHCSISSAFRPMTGPLPSSHYVQYTTIVTSHNTLLDLLDVRVHPQFKYSPCHRQWGLAWTGQWPAGRHQHGRTELPSGSWSFQYCQSCGAVTPSWWPGRWWCWHGHPLQLHAGHCVYTTKRNEQQLNLWLVQEWFEVCMHFVCGKSDSE